MLYLSEESQARKNCQDQPHGLESGSVPQEEQASTYFTLRIAEGFIPHVSDHEEDDHGKVDTFFQAEDFQPELAPFQIESLVDNRVLEYVISTLCKLSDGTRSATFACRTEVDQMCQR